MATALAGNEIRGRTEVLNKWEKFICLSLALFALCAQNIGHLYG